MIEFVCKKSVHVDNLQIFVCGVARFNHAKYDVSYDTK
jgi:hypothetical protein